MTMQYLEKELRRTGNPRDQAFADIVFGVLKARRKDVPLPQEGTQALEPAIDAIRENIEGGRMRRKRHELTPFGVLLDKHLYDRDIRVGEFADQVGISRTSLSRILWGHKRPSTDLILEIGDKLKLSEDEKLAFLKAVPNQRRRRRKGDIT